MCLWCGVGERDVFVDEGDEATAPTTRAVLAYGGVVVDLWRVVFGFEFCFLYEGGVDLVCGE